MGRLLALDVGKVRIGIAVSDSMQLIANGLTTVLAKDIYSYLTEYIAREPVERFVVGLPFQMNGMESESMPYVRKVVAELGHRYPTIPISMVDERFTSKLASQTMVSGGLSKKKRQNKALIDQISATIILQSYLEQNIMMGNNK